MSFYRYIYKKNNGYVIEKNHVHYGWYEDLRDALHDRDLLEECDWDLGEWVYLERENKYKYMNLPPFDTTIKNIRQYVYKHDLSGRWYIRKRINGKDITFGYFDKLEDAMKRRDELVANNWSV